MKFGTLVGWGIVIYSVMYLALAGLATYGFSGGLFARCVSFGVLLFVATCAGASLKSRTVKDILPHSIFWAVEVALLDIVFTVPYAGWQLYADWNVWVGYALVVVVPLFTTYLSPSRLSTPMP